jgi:hypothetical protein
MLYVPNSLLSYSSFPLHRIKREETQAGIETPYWGELINPFQVGLGNWFTSPLSCSCRNLLELLCSAQRYQRGVGGPC